MQELTQEEWKKGIAENKEAQILDVRTDDEVEEGFIPNALTADIQQPEKFMKVVEGLDKSKDYYIYCRSGARSAQAGQIMNQLGFEDTYNLKGGFKEWNGEVKKP